MNNKMWQDLKVIFENVELSNKYPELFRAVTLINESIELNQRQDEIQKEITKLQKEEK